MPLDFKDYYKSKLRFSMLICSLGSVSYILILGIVCMVTGIVPITGSWVFLYSAFVCVLCNLIFVNRMLVSNAKSPVFSRDSETEISRKLGGINAVALIVGFVMYIALFVFIIIAMIPELSVIILSSTTVTVAAVTAAVFALLIFVIYGCGFCAPYICDRCSSQQNLRQKSREEFDDNRITFRSNDTQAMSGKT